MSNQLKPNSSTYFLKSHLVLKLTKKRDLCQPTNNQEREKKVNYKDFRPSL